LAGVAIGYDFIVNNFLIGLVVEAETDLGKAKQEKKALTTIQLQQYTTQDLTANKTWDLKLTGKRQFSIGGKLKLGYLFTDACVLYVAPGYSYTNYKITATMTDTTPGTTPKKGNAKVGKGSFVVSGGIGYNIYENWVMSAEYTFGGKATKKIKDTAGKEVIRYTYKHQSVKLGIKYVF
jgi:opacity protein-like surface antigen